MRCVAACARHREIATACLDAAAAAALTRPAPAPARLQVQQLHAEPDALEVLASSELEELEGKLDGSMRAVREALMTRKVVEAARRSSSEQNQCTLCMEAARSVAFSCGHQSCEPCSAKLAACPFCRVTISAKIRLYDA